MNYILRLKTVRQPMLQTLTSYLHKLLAHPPQEERDRVREGREGKGKESNAGRLVAGVLGG